MTQWWGRGNKLDIERYEFRPGGQWRFVEHSDHGVHGFGGSYRGADDEREVAAARHQGAGRAENF